MAGLISNTRTPHEIDAELAAVVYGERGRELSDFFIRRAGNAVRAAELLGETFAKAAQVRMKRDDRDANDVEWLTSIAHLELSHFLRGTAPTTTAVNTLGMSIPTISEIDITEYEVTAVAA